MTFAALPSMTAPVVLIADDDSDVRASLEEGLREAGFDPHCVRNGDEALAYLRRNPPPSAILLDLFMPVMDGWDVIAQLEADGRLSTTKIVIITSAAHKAPAGIPVFEKPLDLDKVIGAVEIPSERDRKGAQVWNQSHDGPSK